MASFPTMGEATLHYFSPKDRQVSAVFPALAGIFLENQVPPIYGLSLLQRSLKTEQWWEGCKVTLLCVQLHAGPSMPLHRAVREQGNHANFRPSADELVPFCPEVMLAGVYQKRFTEQEADGMSK